MEEEEAKLEWMIEWEKQRKPLPPQAHDTFGIKGYKCRKCTQDNVKMMTVQTRSIDERSCQLFHCQNPKCNFKWKE